MDKLDMLFVRACKTLDPDTRLRSVVRRFFLIDPDDGRELIIGRLAELCDDYGLISISTLTHHLSPFNAWKYTESPNGDTRYGVLLSIVRLSQVSKFPGLISPRRFRND